MKEEKPKTKPIRRVIFLVVFVVAAIICTVLVTKMNNCDYYNSYEECIDEGTTYCCPQGVDCPLGIDGCKKLVSLQNASIYVVAIGMVISYIFVIGISISIGRHVCFK